MAIENLTNPANAGVIQHLIDLGTAYARDGNKQKSGTFFRVSMALRGIPDLIDENYDCTQHKGIGGSSQKEVTQFLQTGTSERLQGLQTANADADSELPLPERISNRLADKSSLPAQAIKVAIVLTAGLNQLMTLEDYRSNVDKFEQHIRDAGLEEVLADL